MKAARVSLLLIFSIVAGMAPLWASEPAEPHLSENAEGDTQQISVQSRGKPGSASSVQEDDRAAVLSRAHRACHDAGLTNDPNDRALNENSLETRFLAERNQKSGGQTTDAQAAESQSTSTTSANASANPQQTNQTHQADSTPPRQPSETAMRAAKSRLSPAAQEVARDLGILSSVQELLDAEELHGKDSIEALRVRQTLFETILTASFEIRSAVSRIDAELSDSDELRNTLEEKREKKVERSNIINFMNSGTTGILTSALTNLERSPTPGLIHAGGIIGVVGGALEIGISTYSMKLNRGDRESCAVHPNMLAPIFGYKGSDAHFPEGVWEYLTDPYPGGAGDRETRQKHLVGTWVHHGRLSTKEGQHQIDLVTGVVPERHELTIDILDDRALMLKDLRATVTMMDSEMLEILHWIHTL